MSPQAPVPVPDPDTAPFWAATLGSRLDLQRCTACDRLVFYPRARCPACHASTLRWERVSGRGTVYSYTVVHRPAHPSLAEAVPYVVALVDLEEGARLMTNIIGCRPEEVRIGMAVRVRFRRVSEDAALPLFEPEGRPGARNEESASAFDRDAASAAPDVDRASRRRSAARAPTAPGAGGSTPAMPEASG